ncbi:hypothetical protein ACFFGH_17710 [Lysobacter korlensis]|uniref:DUF1330 domain-containing protein n=1 Tax=Lysobacter korlensis TaxID=553636 RepID=A0ABV6RUU8_9GAMM
MHLIQLFLPVYDNNHQPFSRSQFDTVRTELADTFGGVTAFTRSPAAGLWEDDDGDVCRDDVVLIEVMADMLDRQWWSDYRRTLEQRFQQEEVLIRASAVERL